MKTPAQMMSLVISVMVFITVLWLIWTLVTAIVSGGLGIGIAIAGCILFSLYFIGEKNLRMLLK